MSIKSKIESLNKQFEELGIDYKFDTRPKKTIYVLIYEEGMDVGDRVVGVYDSKEEAEKDGDKWYYKWRIEEYCCRMGK